MTNVVTESSMNSTTYFVIGCGKLLVNMVLQIVPMLSMSLKAATPIPALCAVTLFSSASSAWRSLGANAYSHFQFHDCVVSISIESYFLHQIRFTKQ